MELSKEVAAFIDENSVKCEGCGHLFIDVTAALDETGNTLQHCIAGGDMEGDGMGCGHCINDDFPETPEPPERVKKPVEISEPGAIHDLEKGGYFKWVDAQAKGGPQ